MIIATTNAAFSQAAKKLTFGKTPDQDGIVRFDNTNGFSGIWGLYEMNNNYSMITNNTPVQDFLFENVEYGTRLNKYFICREFLLAPGADTLVTTLHLNNFVNSVSGYKGNTVIASDELGNTKRVILSGDGKINNTADSTLLSSLNWKPAIVNGVSGYKYCMLYFETSIPDVWCTTTSGGYKAFYVAHKQGFWCNKYTKKSPTASGPFIGSGTRGGLVKTIGFSDFQSGVNIHGYMEVPKIPDIEPTIKPGSFGAWSETYSTAHCGVGWNPSNLENTSIVIECFQGGILKDSRTIESTWELVDHHSVMNGVNRNDGQGSIFEFTDLEDTTLTTFKVFIIYSDGSKVLKETVTTYTLKKKVVEPVKTDPKLVDVIVSDVTDVSAVIDIIILNGTNTGNANATITVVDAGSILLDSNIVIPAKNTPDTFKVKINVKNLKELTSYVCNVKVLNNEIPRGFSTLKSSSGGGGTVSISNVSKTQVNFYPNPVSDMLYVTKGNKESVTIIDLSGRTVINSLDSEISMSSQSPGLYLVRIGDRGAQLLEKK